MKDDSKNLIPAIIQDASSGEVLMLAYMNRQSLEKSLETGMTWFWSRSKNKLWNKGETSGNIQEIKEIKYDCDGDSLLVLVEQTGNACHTGNRSCFYRMLEEISKDIDFEKNNKSIPAGEVLYELYEIIESRIKDKIPDSYTYSLHKKGLDQIIKKIGEESTEIIIASKYQKKKDIINEIADLIYHLLVLFVEKNISLDEVFGELKSRRK